MSTIQRVRVPWSGGTGGPGLSTFYALDAGAALGPIHTFFDTLKASVPTGISWQFPGAGDTIVAETGVLSGSWAATGQPLVLATGPTAGVAAPVGAVFKWTFGAVLFGHRITGRTFLVPMVSGGFTGGALTAEQLTLLGNAAAALVNAVPGNLVIWSRPVAATPQWTDVQGRVHPARPARTGSATPITGSAVPNLAVVLRSRRD